MPLLNVKLKADDARMARALRKEGVVISAVVRDAIRAEYRRRIAGRASGMRASKRMAEIYAAHPDPTNLPPRTYDVHDARAARDAVRRALRRR